MLHQKRSGSSARLKYLLVLPLLGGAFCASTLAFAKDYGIDIAPKHVSESSGSLETKLLKITSGGTTLITDKLSIHERDGKVVTYTGNMLTSVDKDYLLKKHKIAVDIYQVGDLRKYKEVSDVNIYASGARKKVDSAIKATNQKIRNEVKSQIEQQKNLNKLPTTTEQPRKIAADDTALHAFYMQIARNTRYPVAARDNKVTGRVFAVFNVDENNNIVNVGVLRSPDKVMSQEVVRVLKGCSGKFKGQTDVTYTIPVSFNIVVEQTGKYLLDAPPGTPKQDAVIPRDQPVKTSKNIYLSEVVVTSYLKQ